MQEGRIKRLERAMGKIQGAVDKTIMVFNAEENRTVERSVSSLKRDVREGRCLLIGPDLDWFKPWD